MKKMVTLVALLTALASVSVGTAQANPTTTPATVKAFCVVGSGRPLAILIREQIRAQYLAAGHKNVFASVVFKPVRTQAQPLSFTGIQGVTSVTVAPDGSTVTVGTNTTPVGLACSIEVPATIKVSYVPANSTTSQRKLVTVEQKMILDGFFR